MERAARHSTTCGPAPCPLAAAFALALGALGCSEAPPTRGDPPRVDRPPLSSIGAPGARHFDQLPPLEEAMRAALAAAPPNRAAIVAAAGALHASADRILADRPAWVRGGDRTQYEGLLIQLKQRALDLQEAAQDASALGLERARGRVSATCVQCHALFATPPAGASPASRREGS